MKRFYITMLAAIMGIAATFNASAQQEQTRQVSGFNSIGASGSFNVHVKIDGTESLKLKGDEAVLKKIETVVENGKLEIRFKRSRGWWNNDNDHHGKIEVYVTAKSLLALAEAGSGSIVVDGALSGEHVNIMVSGPGNINAAVKSGNLHVAISGSGNIKLEGTTTDANIVISGSGSINAQTLNAGSVNAVITGSGNAHIHADKNIVAHLVGSGSLRYTGNATVSDVKTVGSGSVSKGNE